jgi:hypothetical protein
LPLDQVLLGGVPQPVFKTPFLDYAEADFYAVTIPDLLDRVIVGPTQSSAAMGVAGLLL